jgi:hypothetical protein
MLDFFKLPGFAEAAATQSAARDLPFLGVSIPIAGANVLPITLRGYTVISQAGNPWVCGGMATDAAALAFIWVVSDEYEFAKAPPKKFIERFARQWNDEERVKLDEYVDLMFLDTNSGDSTNRDASKVSAAASYIHLLTKAYGWTREQILDTPISELNQYVRCIAMDNDSGAVNKLTDRIKSQFLIDLNAMPVEERDGWIANTMRGKEAA